MPTSHDLKGLMKFMSRDPWDECFDEIFEDHFGAVLGGDMKFADLADVIGDDGAMTLWGCAFEDFLTQEFEVPGGNIVDEYLRRRGWKEGAQSKAYMKALRGSVMSLYEVSEVVPGKSFMARDLVRGGGLIAVSEGTATKTLKQWDRIAARIVPVMGKHVLAGGLLPFTLRATDMLFERLHEAFGEDDAGNLPVISDADLGELTFLFTDAWLLDTLGTLANVPSVRNADGDDFVLHTVSFPLAAGVSQKQLAAHLKALPGLQQENSKFWNWLADKPQGRAAAAGTVSLDTTMDDGRQVIGNIELKGRFLHLVTNSAPRAERGILLIQESLGALVRAPLTEIRTVEQMLADAPAGHESKADDDVPPEMAEQLIWQYMDGHYRETLDQPIAMLDNKSPREAVTSAAGRKKVAEWLKYLENQSGRRVDPDDPMARYDYEWMWRELGVLDLRE